MKPDIEILIGAKGGYQVDGESGKLIENQLKAVLNQMTGSHMPRVIVGINKEQTAKLWQSQLQQIANGLTVKLPVSGTGSKTTDLPAFNVQQLQSSGKSYIRASQTVLEDVKRAFSSLGTVDIGNVFKTAQGEIGSFTATVKKSDGTVEAYRHKLAMLQDGETSFKGFVQTGSVLTDKTAGTELQKTLTYLSGIETRLTNINSKTLTATQKPLLNDMPEYTQYSNKLQSVAARIDELRRANDVLSDEHKREINSMVADLQRYAKELQTSAYASTDLKAQAFTVKKTQLQSDLENQIKQWQGTGLVDSDMEQSIAKAKALLDSATDSSGLDEYISKFRLLKSEFRGLSIDNGAWDTIAKANTLGSNISTAQLRIQNLKKQYSAFVSDPQLRQEWQSLFDQSQIVKTQAEVTDLNAKIAQFEQRLISAGKHGVGKFSELANNFQKMASWMIMGTVITGITGGLRGMYSSVVDVNTQMTELRKVTDEADATYSKFVTTAAERTVALSSSLSDYIEATSNYARLGYSLGQSQELAETALIYKNVGDEVESVDAATKSIISTMKAFRIESDKTSSIIDKLNEVGNNFAISSGGIGEALQRSAAALSVAGNTLDESIALIVAANNVVQNPERVGTMWQTVTARIRGATAELEEAGLETEGMVETTSKLQEKVMALTNVSGAGGVNILADADTFKSTYSIMLEISKVWDKISDVDQAALLELLAGKRQSNALSSAITNMDDAVKVLETSVSSAGSASREYEKWLESIEAKQQRFQAQYDVLSQTVLSSDLIKGTIDTGTGLLGWLTAVVDRLGALPVLIAALSGLRSLSSDAGVFKIDPTKNWGGSGMGITTSFANNSKILHDFQAQVTTDVQCLTALENAVQSNNFVVSDFSKIMEGASGQAKTYAAQTKGAAGSAVEFGVAQSAVAESLQHTSVSAAAASVAVTALKVAMNMLIGMAVTAAIVGIVKAVDALNVTLDEQREISDRLRASYDEITNSIKELNGQLEETISRINELQGKDSLSFTEQEELENLEKQNQYLQTQIDLLEKRQKLAAQDANASVVSEYEKDFRRDGEFRERVDFGNAQMAYRTMDEERHYIEQIGLYKQLLAQLNGEDFASLSAAEQDKLQTQISAVEAYLTDTAGRYADLANKTVLVDDASQEFYEKMMHYATMGNNALNGINWSDKSSSAFSSVWDDTTFESTRDALQALANEGKVTADALNDPQYADFISALKEAGGVGGNTGVTVEELANHINSLGQSASTASDAVTELATLTSIVESLEAGVSALTNAQKEMTDTGYLSVSSIKAIVAAGLSQYLVATADGYILAQSALDDYITSQREEYEVALTQSVSAANSIITKEEKVATGFNTTTMSIYEQIEAMQKLAKARWLIWNQANQEFINRRVAQGDTVSEASRMSQYNQDVETAYSSYKALSDILNEVNATQVSLASFDRVAASYKRDAVSSSSSSSVKEKTMAELYPELTALEEETEHRTNRLSKMSEDTTARQVELWMDLRKQAVSQLNKITDKTSEAYKYVEDIVKNANDNLADLYDDQLDSINDIVDMVKDMIKQQADDQVDALEEQVDLYDELIDRKKELLEADSAETNYEKELENRLREISDLQHSISQLELEINTNPNDSRKAQAEQQKLVQELADAQQELADFQASHWRDVTIESLENSADAFESSKEDEIDVIEETVDTEGKLYQQAIKYIEDNWEDLYDQLLRYNRVYGSGIDDDITSAWDTAKNAVEDYGGSIEAAIAQLKTMQSMIQSGTEFGDYVQVDALTTNSSLVSIVKQMKANSEAYLKASDANTKASIKASQASLVSQFNQISGQTLSQGSDGTWYLPSGDTLYSHFGVGDIVNSSSGSSSSNSSGTGAAYKKTVASYGNPPSGTLKRGSSGNGVKWLQAYLNEAVDASLPVDGTFYTDTEKALKQFQNNANLNDDGIYGPKTRAVLPQYHSGGVVGAVPTLEDNELIATLERNEVVLTSHMWDNVSHVMDHYQRMMKWLPKISGITSAVPASAFTGGGGAFENHITVNLTNNGPIDESTVDSLAGRIGEQVIGQLTTKLKMNGHGKIHI